MPDAHGDEGRLQLPSAHEEPEWPVVPACDTAKVENSFSMFLLPHEQVTASSLDLTRISDRLPQSLQTYSNTGIVSSCCLLFTAL